MGDDNSQRIRELVRRALMMESDERQQFLAASCGNDQKTREEVEALISKASLRTPAVVRDEDTVPAKHGLQIRCPHCNNANQITVDATLTDLDCAVCGSHFSLAGGGEETQAARTLTSIGHFQLVERLGVGGSGTVWKAHDTQLERTVAVKIPRIGHLNAVESEQFFREARAVAQLNHPNIVSVYEIGRHEDQIYIVSEFVRGVTLADWLTGQRLTAREAAQLCRKIANVLMHAHDAGVIHRDLKPQNIMMDPQGEPHLMDFGLARRESGEVTMTLDGQILGTPA